MSESSDDRKRLSLTHSVPSKAPKDNLCEEIVDFFVNTRNGFLLALWILWMLVGTIFYTYYLEIGWSQGFYMAVNVGYSVGWGDIPEPYAGGQIFSTIYVICGASFVGAALGIFGEMAVSNHKNWYEEAEKAMFIQSQLEKHDSVLYKTYYWMAENFALVRPILLWFLIVIICIIFACVINDWDFATGLYFAVSSLSTGGLVSLPAGSHNAYYGLLGIYGAFGIPLMALAMGTFAGFFISNPSGNLERIMEQVQEEVTEEELKMLDSFNLDLDDDKTSLNKGEFLILSMVRIGAAGPDLIQTINAYFDELDVDGSKSLDIDELKKKKTLPGSDLNKGKDAMKRQFEKKAAKRLSGKLSLPSTSQKYIEVHDTKVKEDKADALTAL
jgi:hypothetical protein